jgi:hypothetical protein
MEHRRGYFDHQFEHLGLRVAFGALRPKPPGYEERAFCEFEFSPIFFALHRVRFYGLMRSKRYVLLIV